MRVFVYEFVTGGGCWSLKPPQVPAGSLLAEGSAMAAALATDFLRLPHASVTLLRDRRLASLQLPGKHVVPVQSEEDEQNLLSHYAAESDWTVVIAPEFDGSLHKRCQWVQAAGGRLLSPDPGFVELATDKSRTARHLSEAGLAIPAGRWLGPAEPLPVDFDYPAVLKPNDGAGSVGIRRLHGPDANPPDSGACWRLERECPGQPVSVALLSGPSATKMLPPCAQRLSQDGRFLYQGGHLPLPQPLSQRASLLAQQVIQTMPTTCGYWGIDLVLGQDGSHTDVVVEINPRLTTSYLGLRRAARINLAEAMLAVAEGRDFELSFVDERVEFAAGDDRTGV
jgi:predicted ATP-grasp superfamily ATP-dependent carboligase